MIRLEIMDRTIAIRALNYLRLVHTPSYVGLRLLLQRSAFTSSDVAISALVEEGAISQTTRIFEVKRFKKIDENGGAHFRTTLFLLPLTHLPKRIRFFT